MASFSDYVTKAELWSCPMCTFDNKMSAHKICEQCRYEDKSEDDSFLEQDEISMWSCSKCTLDNKMNVDYCEACGMRKDSATAAKISVLKPLELAKKERTMNARTRRHHDLDEARKNFECLIAFHRQSKIHFVDESFPHSERSLGTHYFRSYSRWLPVYKVSRSEMGRSQEWSIFSDPSPNDIQQGELGNCWLVATIALVSENVKLLKHILVTQETNREGIYLVRICFNGLWKTVMVDDSFPCTRDGRLVFTKAKRAQLYVPLIEKACAKAFGSYGALRSGTLLEGLQLLTGAPCDSIELESIRYPMDLDIIWSKLVSACESKLLIGVSSGNMSITKEEYKNVGIHGNHAFSILAVYSFSPHHSSMDEWRYVLVRDPHSYSRYAEKTLNETKLGKLRSIHSADRSSGAFWISWASFSRYFTSITISRYDAGMYEARETGKFTRNASESLFNYHFELIENSSVYISLIYHRQDRSTRNRHVQSFILCDAHKNRSDQPLILGRNLTILRSKRAGFVQWQGILNAGTYALIPFSFTFWHDQGTPEDFTVVIHSVSKLQLQIKRVPATFLTDSLIAFLSQHSDYTKQKNNTILRGISKPQKFSMHLIENQSTTEFLAADILFNSDSKELLHFPSERQILACIPPFHCQIVLIMEWNDELHHPSKIGYKQSIHHEKNPFNPIPNIDRSRPNFYLPRPIFS